MSSDSGEDIFITQSKYSEQNLNEIISDTNLIDNVLDLEEEHGNQPFKLRTDLFSDMSESQEDIMLVKASQAAEEQLEKRRFGPLQSENNLKELVGTSVPQSTLSKCKWAVNTFETWRRDRNTRAQDKFEVELLRMEDPMLDKALSFFTAEVRNQAGGEYQPKSLYEMIMSIQSFLRFNDRIVNLLDDTKFVKTKRVLDAKMKALSRKGVGLNRKQAGIISVQQENALWSKGVMGTDTPQKLLNALIYGVGLNFALRAGKEHRNLRVGTTSQLKLVTPDSDGPRYLQYQEDVSKTNCGGLLHKKVEAKTTRAYENISCPERCVVRMYEKYLSKRPPGGTSLALYLRPKKKFIEDSVWYDDVPVGIHTLQSTVGTMCKEAGFVGHYTNHSLRATAATRLYAAGVDEQLITEKTGHRSSAVRSYKRTSDEQQEEVSSILQTSKVPKLTNDTLPAPNMSEREFNFQGKGMSIHLKF